MKASHSIEIRSTPENVFYWLEDPSRAVRWMTSVTKTEIIEEADGMVGTTFREYVEEDGRGTEMHGIVTEFVPNERMAFRLEGDYNSVEVVFSLEEVGETTRLSQDADIRFKGFLRVLSFFFAAAFKRKLAGQTEKEFQILKELCEQGPS